MFDWGNLISALAGAGVTFAITVYGRREAHKESRQARIDAIEDERRRAEIGRRQDLDRYAREACGKILDAVEERFSLDRSEMEEPEDYKKADELVRVLYHQAVYMPDKNVRRLIDESAVFFDYRAPLAESGIDLREIVYAVRRMLHGVLGAWLREEDIPDLDSRYIGIRDVFENLPKYARSKHDVGKGN